MPQARARRVGKVIGALVVMATIAGCATPVDSEKPFSLIKPADGWMCMDVPPAESAAMLAQIEDEPFKGDLIRMNKYKHVWFSRGTDDYLLYLQAHSYIEPSDCDDVTMEFARIDGRWGLKDKHAVECLD